MVPKVSVILPSFNHAKFLNQRIDSILNQTYQDFELIILDDCSVDASQSIISEFRSHPKVASVMFNFNNTGNVFKQWIKGIELAKGDYIWIAESDDFADTNFLKDTVKELNDDTTIGLVFTDSIKVNENNDYLGTISKSKPQLKQLLENGGQINKYNNIYYLLEKLVVVNASSVLFRRSCFNDINFSVLANFKNTGDVFVYVGISLHSQLKYLPKQLNFMRLHNSNSTKKNKNAGFVFKDKIQLISFYLNCLVKDPNQISTLKKSIYNIFFFSLDNGYNKELFTLLSKMFNLKIITSNNFFSLRVIQLIYSSFGFIRKSNYLRNIFKKRVYNILGLY